MGRKPSRSIAMNTMTVETSIHHILKFFSQEQSYRASLTHRIPSYFRDVQPTSTNHATLNAFLGMSYSTT